MSTRGRIPLLAGLAAGIAASYALDIGPKSWEGLLLLVPILATGFAVDRVPDRREARS